MTNSRMTHHEYHTNGGHETLRRANLARWEKRAWKVYNSLDEIEGLLNQLHDVFPDDPADTSDYALLGSYARDVMGTVRAARAKLACGLDEHKRIKAKK